MLIESIRHKALRKFAEMGRSAGVLEPERLSDMLTYINASANFTELLEPPNFSFHALKVDRKGEFAMTVTIN